MIKYVNYVNYYLQWAHISRRAITFSRHRVTNTAVFASTILERIIVNFVIIGQKPDVWSRTVFPRPISPACTLSVEPIATSVMQTSAMLFTVDTKSVSQTFGRTLFSRPSLIAFAVSALRITLRFVLATTCSFTIGPIRIRRTTYIARHSRPSHRTFTFSIVQITRFVVLARFVTPDFV